MTLAERFPMYTFFAWEGSFGAVWHIELDVPAVRCPTIILDLVMN